MKKMYFKYIHNVNLRRNLHRIRMQRWPEKKPKREENVAEKIACEMENETLKIQRLHINIICRPSSRNPN